MHVTGASGLARICVQGQPAIRPTLAGASRSPVPFLGAGKLLLTRSCYESKLVFFKYIFCVQGQRVVKVVAREGQQRPHRGHEGVRGVWDCPCQQHNASSSSLFQQRNAASPSRVLCMQGQRIVKVAHVRGSGGPTDGMDAREAHNARRREKRRLAALAK